MIKEEKVVILKIYYDNTKNKKEKIRIENKLKNKYKNKNN